ncbi:MAG: murein biosynthesis integral membrane protein MurJ [Pyrinomonadaceae bacterium]
MSQSEKDDKNLIASEAASDSEDRQTSKSVARSAGIVSIAVMFSRVLGLVRESVFAYYFGSGYLYDAYQVAFRIPNVLRDLFAEGALSVAFVKVFTDYQIHKSEKDAWRLASLVLNGLVVVLSAITLLGIIFAPQIVGLIASGFPPEIAALATTMTRIMFPFILFIAMAALAMGVLNTKGIFGVPASASTAFNVVSVLIGLLLAYWFSGGSWQVPPKGIIPSRNAELAIIGMSIGTLIAGAAQFLIQVPWLYKVGFRFTPVLNFADEGVRKVAKLMAPAIIGTSAVQINVMINTFFVSGIEGGVSYLSYAFRLMQFPIGVFGVAIGTASIPALSRLASKRSFGEFRNTLSNSLNLVFLLTLPSACGLVVLGSPIIRLLYSHGGAFKESDVPMAAAALGAYAIGLTGYAAIKVLSPSFYALDDAKVPMIIAVCSIAVNAVASYYFLKLFSNFGVSAAHPGGYGHAGVALATSCVALVNFFALIYMMHRKIGSINGGNMIRTFVKIAFASAIMSVVCWYSYQYLTGLTQTKHIFEKLYEVVIPISLGSIVFFAVVKILRVDELEQFVKLLKRRLVK